MPKCTNWRRRQHQGETRQERDAREAVEFWEQMALAVASSSNSTRPSITIKWADEIGAARAERIKAIREYINEPR